MSLANRIEALILASDEPGEQDEQEKTGSSNG